MKKRVSRREDDADRKLDSNERMTWIEEGGIDLRAARQSAVKAAPQAKPAAAPKPPPKAKAKAKPKPKPKSRPKAKAGPRAKAKPKSKGESNSKTPWKNDMLR